MEGREEYQRPLGEGLSKERERKSRVEELECDQGSGMRLGGLSRQCDSLTRPLAQGAMMMMMNVHQAVTCSKATQNSQP